LKVTAYAAAFCGATMLMSVSAHATNDGAESCLATAMYFEARGEPETGQLAVGQVIINRAAHAGYPSTVCGVVYQNAQRRNACQFSFACDAIPDRVRDPSLYASILERARLLLSGRKEMAPDIAGSTHYHATSVAPGWSAKLRRTGQIGEHIFYQCSPA
jgi:spore germination cell wall hydrolase CwlJ-like protein